MKFCLNSTNSKLMEILGPNTSLPICLVVQVPQEHFSILASSEHVDFWHLRNEIPKNSTFFPNIRAPMQLSLSEPCHKSQ